MLNDIYLVSSLVFKANKWLSCCNRLKVPKSCAVPLSISLIQAYLIDTNLGNESWRTPCRKYVTFKELS